jgi:tripartite-type tricarboxylate transporter receptor subunit TctC
VIQKLNAQVTAIGQSKDARAQLDKLGITPVSMRPDEFGKFVREQMVVFRNIAKQANIQPQ